MLNILTYTPPSLYNVMLTSIQPLPPPPLCHVIYTSYISQRPCNVDINLYTRPLDRVLLTSIQPLPAPSV